MSKRELMKKHYCETLLEMCEEQPLSSITVSALIKRAGTAKQTFYNNFRDLNDLINFIPRTYMILAGFHSYSPRSTLQAYRFASKHKGFFGALATHKGQNNFRDEFISFAKYMEYREFLTDDLSEEARFERKLAIDVYTIGVVDHFLEWCGEGLEWPPDVLARIHAEAAPAFMREWQREHADDSDTRSE